MEALTNHLKQLYEQSPSSRYYNVDVLRYQIAPIQEFERCPLQVCAYWKSEPKLTKLRIDFKHSSKCGLNLERLRDVKFCVDLANFIPAGVDVSSLSPDSLSSLRLNNNNNNAVAMNMNASMMPVNSFYSQPINNMQPATAASTRQQVPILDQSLINYNNIPTHDKREPLLNNRFGSDSVVQVRIPPPPTSSHLRSNNSPNRTPVQVDAFNSSPTNPRQQFNSPLNQFSSQSTVFGSNLLTSAPLMSLNRLSIGGTQLSGQQSIPCNTISNTSASIAQIPPYITYEPQAYWSSNTKQLTWKFDNLLSYYKTDGFGSLLAKLDFRNYNGMLPEFLHQAEPSPVDVKFMVVDSTLSKISMSIDTAGYRMSLLKKEIRSGRYKSEPYVF